LEDDLTQTQVQTYIDTVYEGHESYVHGVVRNENEPLSLWKGSYHSSCLQLVATSLQRRLRGRRLLLLGGTSNPNHQSLQPSVFASESLAFALQLVDTSLEFLGSRLESGFSFLLLQPETRRGGGVTPALVLGHANGRSG